MALWRELVPPVDGKQVLSGEGQFLHPLKYDSL